LRRLPRRPAAGQTLRCERPRHPGFLFLRIGDGRFEPAEAPDFRWRDYCGPGDAQDRFHCGRRHGHLVAAVEGVDTGRDLEFNPIRLTLILRDHAAVQGIHSSSAKLRCAPAARGAPPPG
jgi:hypothetical protein